jgi:hypothetical protein
MVLNRPVSFHHNGNSVHGRNPRATLGGLKLHARCGGELPASSTVVYRLQLLCDCLSRQRCACHGHVPCRSRIGLPDQRKFHRGVEPLLCGDNQRRREPGLLHLFWHPGAHGRPICLDSGRQLQLADAVPGGAGRGKLRLPIAASGWPIHSGCPIPPAPFCA